MGSAMVFFMLLISVSAMIELPVELVSRFAPGLEANAETVTCLRSVLMKPEHADWLDQIMTILEAAAQEARE